MRKVTVPVFVDKRSKYMLDSLESVRPGVCVAVLQCVCVYAFVSVCAGLRVITAHAHQCPHVRTPAM